MACGPLKRTLLAGLLGNEPYLDLALLVLRGDADAVGEAQDRLDGLLMELVAGVLAADADDGQRGAGGVEQLDLLLRADHRHARERVDSVLELDAEVVQHARRAGRPDQDGAERLADFGGALD